MVLQSPVSIIELHVELSHEDLKEGASGVGLLVLYGFKT